MLTKDAAATIGLMMGWLLPEFRHVGETPSSYRKYHPAPAVAETQVNALSHELRGCASAVRMTGRQMITLRNWRSKILNRRSGAQGQSNNSRRLQTELREKRCTSHAAEARTGYASTGKSNRTGNTVQALSRRLRRMQSQMENARACVIWSARIGKYATLKRWVEQLRA